MVPNICDQYTAQPISTCAERYSHLAQLNLADVSQDETLEMDVLIGSDFYWEFATGKIIHGQSVLVAVGTKLGWVLVLPCPSPDWSFCLQFSLRN